MKGLTSSIFIIALLIAGPLRADGNLYVSEADKLVTIHKVGVLPVTDNVGGLYSRYVEDKLGEFLKDSHRFDLSPVREVDSSSTLDDYEGDPDQVKSIASKNGADALIGARVTKTKNGVDITLDLFLAPDGLLFLQTEGSTAPHFDVSDLESKTSELYYDLVAKLPYKGLILSREGNRVTMDLGTKDGVKGGTIVSVEQIISIKRHPKFHFLVSAEKEILGKVKIVKADTTLSFGVVLEEKDRGVIVPDSKVSGVDYVVYPDAAAGTPQALGGPATPSDQVSFGNHPKEWLPEKQPSIGKVSLSLGLGSLHDALTLQNEGSFSTDASIYPQLNLSGELWLTPNWYVAAGMTQGVMSFNNPNASSSPGSLGSNNAHYDFHGGYKFLLQDDFFGPQLNLHAGLARYSLFVDASTPLTLTSQTYSGLYLGIGGSMPVNDSRDWYIDVNLDKFVSPDMTETPLSSGAASDNSATDFTIGVEHKLTNQFWLNFNLDFEFYTSTFSGTGTRSDPGLNSSQILTTLFGGVEYRF